MKHVLTAGLVLAVLLSAAASARAQHPGPGLDYPDENYLPGPQLKTGSLFAPLDISGYGSGPKRNTGYFVEYDYLVYMIDRPDVGQIPTSLTGPIEPVNPYFPPDAFGDTSSFSNNFQSGSRLDLGWTDGTHGWVFSGWDLNSTHRFQSLFTSETRAAINASDATSLGVDFSAANSSDLKSFELMYSYRLPRSTPPMAYESQTELFAGARFIHFRDQFNADSNLYAMQGIQQNNFAVQSSPGVLLFQPPYNFENATIGYVHGYTHTNVENNMVGPQLGFRHTQQRGPIQYDVQGRAMMGFNMVSARSRAALLDPFILLDPAGAPIGVAPDVSRIDSSQHFTEILPIIEFRASASYSLTRYFALEAGWSCIYIGNGVTRGVGAIDANTFQLRQNPRAEDMFMHGLNLGVVFNR